MMKKIALFLALAAGVFAADPRVDITTVGKKMDPARAQSLRAMAGTGLDGLVLPQAAGIITTAQTGNSGQYIYFTTVAPITSPTCIFGAMMAPNGDTVTTDTYCITADMLSSAQGGEWVMGMELWNGAFPGSWPSGITRFRVIMQNGDGKLTEVNAFIPVRSCCAQEVPIISAITPSTDGTRLTVTGQFISPLFAVDGQYTPIVPSAPAPPVLQPSGPSPASSTFVIGNPGYQQNSVLTVCDQGYCSQAYFHLPLPPVFNGGKG